MALTKKEYGIVGASLLATALGSYFLGAGKAQPTKKVETLKLEDQYKVVQSEGYVFGFDEKDDLRVVQLIEGQNPFTLSTSKKFDENGKRVKEEQTLTVSGLEVRLTPVTRNASFVVKNKK